MAFRKFSFINRYYQCKYLIHISILYYLIFSNDFFKKNIKYAILECLIDRITSICFVRFYVFKTFVKELKSSSFIKSI